MGGTARNGGDFKRVLDLSTSISPNGVVHLTSLSLTGDMYHPDSDHAVHVSRSADGGRSWTAPQIIVREQGGAVNDLPTITADPTNPRYVYVLVSRTEITPDGQVTAPDSADSQH